MGGGEDRHDETRNEPAAGLPVLTKSVGIEELYPRQPKCQGLYSCCAIAAAAPCGRLGRISTVRKWLRSAQNGFERRKNGFEMGSNGFS